MAEHACDCGICNDCKRAGVDHFSRRSVLGGLLGAVTVGTAQPALAVEPPDLKALETEAFQNLKSLFVCQKAFFAERDKYSTSLDQLGFAPSDWCEDGARLRIKDTPSEFKKLGCHFVYEVETMGTGPAMQFRAYARGAAAPAIGINYLVESGGQYAGIPRHNPK